MITIKEEMRIPGTDVVLEAGDKVEVLKERVNPTRLIDSFIVFLEKNIPGYGSAGPDEEVLVEAYEYILGYIQNDLGELGLFIEELIE